MSRSTYDYFDTSYINFIKEHAGSLLLKGEFSGTLPTEIGLLTNLHNDFVVSESEISGTIPAELGTGLQLNYSLVLRRSRLSGTLPKTLGDVDKITSYIDMFTNFLSGTIPVEIFNLRLLGALALSNNSLSGTIPPQVSKLVQLDKFIDLFGNRLSGTLPPQLGSLTKISDAVYLSGNRLSGSLPSELGRFSPFVMDLADNELDHALTQGEHTPTYRQATRWCGSRTTCTGLPPLSCSAFSGDYVPVVALPGVCVNCSQPVWPEILILVACSTAFLVMLGVMLNYAMKHQRTSAMRFLAVFGGFCTALITHVQALGILGSLGLTWPPLVTKVIALVSLDVLRFPSLSCLLGGGAASTAGVEPGLGHISLQSWFFNLGVVGSLLVLLPSLVLLEACFRRRRKPQAADRVEVALSIIFALPLVTTWYSIASLLTQSLNGFADAAVLRRNAGMPYVHLKDDLLAEAAQLEALSSWGTGLSICLLLVDVALALRFGAQIRRLTVGEATGVWAMPPRRLARRCAYLTYRFAHHAPENELIIWAMQFALLATSTAAERILHTSISGNQTSSQHTLKYGAAAVCLLILCAATAYHERVQPYTLHVQNLAVRWLYGCDIVILIGVGAYSAILDADPSAAAAPVLEGLLVAAILGSVGVCAVLCARAYCRARQALEAVDMRLALSLMDAAIDAPLATALRDGTVRLLRASWIATEASDASLERDATTGAPVMRRLQDLPDAALVPPAEAAASFERGDRSVLALSHAWQTRAHPDPHGLTLQLLRAHLRAHPDAAECAIFWDFACLPQRAPNGPDRTQEEAATFKRALGVMAALYASISGAAVIQQVAVPLTWYGSGTPAPLPYHARGWCRFEEGCALVTATHLEASQAHAAARGLTLHERFARAQASRPKIVRIGGEGEALEAGVSDPEAQLDAAIEALERAHFTSGDDDRLAVQAMLLRFEWIVQRCMIEALRLDETLCGFRTLSTTTMLAARRLVHEGEHDGRKAYPGPRWSHANPSNGGGKGAETQLACMHSRREQSSVSESQEA